MRRFVVRVGLAWLIAAISAVAAGCGGTSSTAAPPGTAATAGASSQQTASPAGTAPATDPPAVTQRFEFDQDPVVDTALAGTDDSYINPGAVLEVDGVLHMFANSFTNFGGRMRVPHLTSEDGITWVLDEQADVLDTNDGFFSAAGPSIDVSTGYVADDGTWVLFFETVEARGIPWQVWRMTAPTPRGPWTIDAEPALPAGDAGAFDEAGVQWPSVVRIGDRWAMYYTGIGASGRGSGVIGLAFSEDGATWTKEPEPVLTPTEQWEFGQLDRPRADATDGGLVMVYSGLDLTTRGLATSTDGLAWTKIAGPSIERSDFPLIGGSWDAALLHRNGELEYFLEIGQSTTKIYRATLVWP